VARDNRLVARGARVKILRSGLAVNRAFVLTRESVCQRKIRPSVRVETSVKRA